MILLGITTLTLKRTIFTPEIQILSNTTSVLSKKTVHVESVINWYLKITCCPLNLVLAPFSIYPLTKKVYYLLNGTGTIYTCVKL